MALYIADEDNLILVILHKSEVESVLRSKCVCRQWLYLISEPEFAEHHFESAPQTEKLLHIASIVPHFRIIDFNKSLKNDSAYKTISPSFLDPPDYHSVNILGSNRGIILLEVLRNSTRTLYLWNPSTNYNKQIKMTSTMLSVNRFNVFLHGFGYDTYTEDYLAVLIWFDDVISCVELFSVSENAWKEVELTHLPYTWCFCGADQGAFVENALHWLVFTYDMNMEIVLAFDFAERDFKEILLPNSSNIDFTIYGSVKLQVLGGLLSLCVRTKTNIGQVDHYSVEIWSMKQYRDHTSWSKTTTVFFNETCSRYFSPICYTETGDIVGTDATKLVKCNEDGEKQETSSSLGYGFYHLYRETFFSI